MPSSLPWLITSLVIVCVALIEEIKMKEKSPDEYKVYSKQTPFLFPFPAFISKLITLPARLVIGKERPENGKEVAMIFFIYLGIMILLSLLFNLIDFLPRSGLWDFPDNVFPFNK